MNSTATPIRCFVGMFDILGFRALRNSRGTAGLHQHFMRSTLPTIEHAAAGARETVTRNGQQFLVPKQGELSCSYIGFSDTVIFSTPDDSFTSFLKIVRASRELLQSGFATKTPYRGAIGYGDLIMGPPVFIGSAIEDAYLGEQSQVWAGCMFTSVAREFVNSQRYLSELRDFPATKAANLPENQREKALLVGKHIAEYPVPVSRNPRNSAAEYLTFSTYVVDWTIGIFTGAAAQAFNPAEEDHPARIIQNTIGFEEWARTNNR
jgi:hypothetical protein